MLRLAVLTLLLLAGLAGQAEAATRVVASAGGVELRAELRKGEICLDAGGNDNCFDRPRSPFSSVVYNAVNDPLGVTGAVIPGIAAVEVERFGGERSRVATVAAGGFRERFFVVPGALDVIVLRFFDAAGTLVGAAQPDTAFETLGPTHGILRVPGATVRVTLGHTLAPTPLQLDRLFTDTCVEIVDERSMCFNERSALEPFIADSRIGCGDRPGVVFGLARPAVARVDLVLGDGRTTGRPAVVLPAAFGEFRGVAVPVPRGRAVRAAIARDAAGKVLGRMPVHAAPSPPRCAADGLGVSGAVYAFERSGTPAPGPLQEVATAPGHTGYAADQDDLLCFGADRIGAADCAPAPVSDEQPFVHRDGRLVYGVFSTRTQTVTLSLSGGGVVRLQARPGPGYTGQYAGRVRFLFGRLPVARPIVRVVARDADGRLLGEGLALTPRRIGRLRTLLRGDGFKLVARRFIAPIDGLPASLGQDCVTLRIGGRDAPGLNNCVDRYIRAEADVACAPRAAVVFGQFDRANPAPAVVLADGRVLRARVARWHGGVGLWAVRVPRRARVVAVRHGRHRIPLAVLPAARQCGYATATESL